ncbi:hypothetical protein N7489_001110 [Penicillium chrysogenum]|uniref:Aminoglycoside phosphotransferase domain-containing protein n=1 Tax=Penicillium chrysogenum TaxID=5076 RepID=A0ABQ8WHP8_PENCH|nr:uncharacterized protein N7489_001110 [Penicillium chrysogenum]KAJ5250700.1 hypothetical protein N7489_001110 [Penicillium chrysogenum]KAJ5266311.1 hypothetical protein N7524_007329 [Penicillium chrysogenum]KAJ5269600.1 hypothetical protein N7505_005358 [Penicillium chrysogenum]
MTTYVLYNRDGAIDEFFNSITTVTRQQCDEFAISRAGGVSSALQMQGVCSYTVTAGPNKTKLFQFRDENSTINMANIVIAKAVHPEFVTSCKYLGTMGDSRPVHIYEMEYLPGTAHIMARIPLDDMPRQHNTIKDFARFFAQSWNNNLQPCSDTTATLLMEFQSSFDLLARNLPSRFAANLERVREELPSLFKVLPFVLSHGDLNMMNLLVNPKTGNITGIVDWAEARILPFGFALYGLEHLLGWMDSEGWHYYDHYCELESLFWQTFREEAHNFSDADLYLISAARMAGFFYHYGFNFDTKGEIQSVRMDRPDGSLAYLDAFCAAGKWTPLS